MPLPPYIEQRYHDLKDRIQGRLGEFAAVPESDYFYELCFCICTPQSRARNAEKVINILKEMDFFNNPFNPSEILRNPAHYIRFHNMKGQRLQNAVSYYPHIQEVLRSPLSGREKRNEIIRLVNGFGLKESSHFMRNIGYRNLAILDRHILKHLVYCGVIEEVPKSMTFSLYLNIEQKFLAFSESLGIAMDELDLLFWSYETGEILK